MVSTCAMFNILEPDPYGKEEEPKVSGLGKRPVT